MQKLGTSLFAVGLTFAAIGCDDGAIDKSEQAIRCERICNRIGECVDGFDDGECRMDCVDMSSDDGYQAEAEDCDKCLDNDNSCTENTTQCAASCSTVVPGLTATGS